MKALVYTGPNQLIFREEPDPEAGLGEVIVKVEAVGICGSDMHAYHGQDARRPAPLILGHEAAGTIVSGAAIGQRVTINPLVIDTNCASVMEGLPHLSPTRQILSMPPRAGAFAQYVLVPEANLVVIPPGLSFAKAALAEPVSVSYHSVKRGVSLLRRPLANARCVVLGAGAIGLASALVLRMMGAGEIQIGEPNARRRQALQRIGPFTNYAPGEPDAPKDHSVDIVIDAVGAIATRAAACAMVRPGGVIVHIGLLPGHEGLDIRKITLQEIIFTGAYCYTPVEFRETVEALASGQLGELDWFEERALADGQRAFADIDVNRIAAAKIILRPF